MRYLALACDYDGTLAHHGRMDDATVAALERVLASGRKLLLVTGRELDDLRSVCPRLDLFERVVAENGALLYRPGSREAKVLAERPPEEFIRALAVRGVRPLGVGRVIVATRHPHETAVLETIRDLGLELQVIFNKDAVMVLPAGINKATGLAAALGEMGLSPHNVAGVGDAENDHAFLRLCECSAAVANALPMLKETADLVTLRDHGAGVAELIERLVGDDLRDQEGRLTRHHLLLGTRDGAEVRLPPYGTNVLIAGPSGSGKSTAATALLERLAEHHYQFCIIDPEGDYESFEGAVPLGNNRQGPSADEVLQLLRAPGQNAVVNLIGLPLADRPGFFQALLPRLLEMRARTGRPHWLVVDEAHHLLPASWQPGAPALPEALKGTLLVTVHPDYLSPAVLATTDTVIAVGDAPGETIRQFCAAIGEGPPPAALPAEEGTVVLWPRSAGAAPFRLRVTPGRAERHRHTRKYAEGELPADRSFYFTGPEGKMHLRAQNLILFLQMADGVDDATWMHHLRHGDYSRWFRECIKDDGLAAEAERVERLAGASARDSRALIRAAVEQRYTLPASPPFPIPGTDSAPDQARALQRPGTEPGR
jgi:hydroxymethylpyrimidine pyrophosphatase-like HAD family hydrolase